MSQELRVEHSKLKVKSPKAKRKIKRPRSSRHPPGPTGFRLSTFDFRRPLPLRIGIGNDVHRLAPGRKLILGGVRVPFEKGPVSHSDGDALAHAVTDALLGAAALGDIGRLFPNTSRRWKNASSLEFLRRAREMLARAGFRVVNVDASVSLERPKLAPHIPRMKKRLAAALGLRPEQISVKAKTGEGLDAVGEGRAIRCDAIALIESS